MFVVYLPLLGNSVDIHEKQMGPYNKHFALFSIRCEPGPDPSIQKGVGTAQKR